MEAEDIIQNKTWSQLTAAEKEKVLPLAATESEYNLLRNLLMVAREEVQDAPAISIRVIQDLHAEIPFRKKRSFSFYYAAASVIVIALAAYFFLSRQPDEQRLVTIPPKSKQLPDTNRQPVVVNNDNINPAVPRRVQKTVQAFPKRSAPSLPDNALRPAPVVRTPDTYVSIINTVENDSSLLAFVTEVY